MRIVLLGAPGAGKGTQCKQIVDKYGLLHLSSGDILRQERAAGTELGRQAQSYMDSGGLVPDELIVKMMAGAVSKAPKVGFVLDGFPRTVVQAEELDKSLAANGQQIDAVLNLEVDDKAVVKRITGRRSCPKCGAIYHIENMKPVKEGICDKDGSGLVQRADDTEEVVANRLNNYHKQTKAVVEYYKSSNVVYGIDANIGASEVKKSMFEILDKFVSAKVLR
ncbi:MAG: adenylate kinase [Candidatus Brocadiia bacterium]|nr:MAG: adenylate kinase [Candidatus Brocadiia bacterium]